MTVKTYRRGFLNKEKGMASFYAPIQYYNPDCVYAAFEINDCNRHVSLDFDFENAEQKENSRYKLDLLIEELQQFKKAIFETPSDT